MLIRVVYGNKGDSSPVEMASKTSGMVVVVGVSTEDGARRLLRERVRTSWIGGVLGRRSEGTEGFKEENFVLGRVNILDC